MPNTLTSANRRVITIAIIVAGVSLAIGLKYFSHAFPEASIEFRVNRDDSVPLATKFLADRGWSVSGYRHAAVFDFDDSAKVYLERTQGLARMDTLTRGPIHLWHWSHRWFKPQQKEEFRVDVTPAGQVVGFDRELPESAAGANLDSSAARALAEKFLVDVMRRDLAGLEFVDSVTEKRPARTDYSFTWKQKDLDLGDGSQRLEVEVDGDQVGSYREFVKVPEGWARDYEKLRSRNEAANVVDEVPWILLCIAGLALLIQRLRKRDVPIHLAGAFAGVTALLYFLGQLNSFSQAEYGYHTTDSYSSFVSRYMVENLLVALALGAFIFLLMASAEPVYRDAYPHLISIRRYFSWQGLRTRSFFIANVVGISLTFFFFAYQTVFYLAADKLGAWAPAEVPFSDLLNTRFPWVMVLFIGFFPAVSEEIQFRAFAIPFLRRFLKSGPLAIVLAAFIWGFLHSLYPNQPFFIRGLEVGVGGIIVGLIMLRFGILATLIWHYSVDALYTAFLLLRSPNHYLMLSGGVAAGIMLIPLIVALAAYLKTGTFSEEDSLLNSAVVVPEPLPENAAAAETELAYRPLSPSRLVLAGVLTLIFAALAFIPVYRFGKGITLHQSPRDALGITDNFMRQRKIDPATYQHVVWINDNVDPSALHYLAERKSLEQADQIYRQATRLALWEVRYYRPLQKEEYTVFVDPVSGEVFGFRHGLEENALGASLLPEQARALAEQAVREHGYRLEDYELQSSDATKRKAREDYTLVWQAKPGDPRNVGDAHYRLEVDIAGDQVVGFSRSFKLPEEWERAQEANSTINNVLLGVFTLTILMFVAGGLILFVNLVRSGQMPWKRSAKFGILLAVLGLLGALNSLPLTNRNYGTSMPMTVWKLMVAVGVIVVPIVEGLFAWLLIGSAVAYYPDAWKVFSRAARRVWRRDAMVAAVVSLAAAAGLSRVDALLTRVFHVYAPIKDELFPMSFSTILPGAGFFISNLTRVLMYAAVAGMVIFIARTAWKLRAWWLWVALALVLVSLGPTHAHSLAAFGVGWLMSFLPLAVAVVLVGFFLRDNILAYLVVLFCVQVAETLMELFAQPNPYFLRNGQVVAVLAGVVLIWMLWPSGAKNGRSVDAGSV
ncbi:MAG: CPBP family intramembrane metalloprotease [Acidobacteriota bacterium]|nr:CPBP family intramembrane metalloprotease [Acidobacteriota bacterium]